MVEGEVNYNFFPDLCVLAGVTGPRTTKIKAEPYALVHNNLRKSIN